MIPAAGKLGLHDLLTGLFCVSFYFYTDIAFGHFRDQSRQIGELVFGALLDLRYEGV